MSHPDTENLEPQEPVEEEIEEVEEPAEEQASSDEIESEAEAEEPPSVPPAAPAIPKDHRMARLMKMRSQYVTEDAIKATEESAKPQPPPAPEIPPEEEEFYEDEEHFDEDFDDEDFDDEDFEDDDYEDEEGLAPAPPPQPTQTEAAAAPAPVEPAPPEEPEEEGDHRVAQLRKLRKQFVTEKDLELTQSASDEPQVYKEVKIQKVICPNCQSEEVRTHKICSSCGAKLPNITSVQEERYNPGTMNTAVMKYVNAVNKLNDGDWSAEEFEDFLHDRQVLTQSHIDDLHELVEECGSQEWLPDATKLLFESTALLEDTLEIMLQKVEDVRVQQADLEAEYDIQLSEYEVFLESEEELDFEMDPPEAPEPVEERIRRISFKADLADIEKSNNQLLNTLKMIDAFQRQGPDDNISL